MKIITIALLVVSLACAASLPSLNFTVSKECPGTLLKAVAIDENNTYVADLVFRLVLWEPYNGLVDVNKTNVNGTVYFKLKWPGVYRIYPNSKLYEYEEYQEKNISMCAPPGPKRFELIIEPDCNSSLLRIKAVEDSSPLDGVFISSGDWSSLTGDSGEAVFPLVEGFVSIHAEKGGYGTQDVSEEISCAPPPECTEDGNCTSTQICKDEKCENVTGVCGYAENHTWVAYGCCADPDCGNESLICTNNTCVEKPAPPPVQNITNITNQTSQAKPEAPASGCAGAMMVLSVLFLVRIK